MYVKGDFLSPYGLHLWITGNLCFQKWRNLFVFPEVKKSVTLKESILGLKNHDYVLWNYTKPTIRGKTVKCYINKRCYRLRSVLFNNVNWVYVLTIMHSKHVQTRLGWEKVRTFVFPQTKYLTSLEFERRGCGESNTLLTLK